MVHTQSTADVGLSRELHRPLGLCSVSASTLLGLSPEGVEVEVSCSRGPAFFQLVGLAQTPVREARVRVASALSCLGVLLEEWAITVNLAPADLHKRDAALDLPIAVAILGAIGRFDPARVAGTLLLGELSLDGRLQPIRGVLPLLIGARERGQQTVIVPAGNAREAGLVRGLNVLLAESLSEIERYFAIADSLPEAPHTAVESELGMGAPCLSEVNGQLGARRSLELAAAGGHNLLMLGPPGAGKTMLARRLPGILPPLEYDEALEATAIHSVAGLIKSERGVLSQRPFRAPHHSVTEQGLVGGGSIPRPGEVSLAHNGVLFLDELPEFQRRALEALRGPLEDGFVTIARARTRVTFPARPILIGAMNPCPCGYYGHPTRPCRCKPAQRERYRTRVSGPLLDRLDVHALLPPVTVAALSTAARSESSESIRKRVAAARRVQLARFRAGVTHARTNAELSAGDLGDVLKPTAAARTLLERAAAQFGLSARAFGKVLRVARTAADLMGDRRIAEPHIAEALQGRLLERGDIG